MSSLPSNSIALLAEAILCLNTGQCLPSSLADALRILSPSPAVEEPVAVAEPVVDAEAPLPVKEKKVRKTAKALAAEAAVAAVPVATDTAPVATDTAAAATDTAVAATGGDPWRTHPSRLSAIDSTYCLGRRIDEKNPLVGTRPGDTGSNSRKVFPEKQCTRKPSPGSKLCAGCAEKDATFKADPTTKNESWYGRLDEESLYPRAKIVGCKYFLEKYPNGIHDDSFRPGGVAATVTATVTTVTAATETKVAAKKQGVKKVATTGTAVAVDTVPVSAAYKSFQHEGRTHIRDLETNKVYYVDLSKGAPEENAVKDQYVGRWVDGRVDLIDDSDEDEA